LKLLLGCLCVVLTIPTLRAQDSRPKFEVASIKECKPGDPHPPSTNSPGRLSLSCWQLKRLIQDAYLVYGQGKVDPLNPFFPSEPLDSAPDWIGSVSYSIDAKSDTPQSPGMMRGPMMQSLLEDRFHLKSHHETREVAVYIMTVAKGGPKLQKAKEDGCLHLDPSDLSQAQPPRGTKVCAFTMMSRQGTATLIDLYGVTLDVFAQLQHPGGRSVINQTGLAGAYDIHLELTNEPATPAPEGAATDPPGASALAATSKQLGLQFTPGRGPVKYFVIDHIDRPSDN
jgi:uncharacterized protein (TIGR03435 family)